MCAMNEPDRLSQSLRELGTRSPRGLDPAAAALLKDAFRRHHRHTRRMRLSAGIALAVLVGVVLVLVGTGMRQRVAQHSLPNAARSAEQTQAATDGPVGHGPVVVSDRGWTAAEASDFVALPSYDPSIPVDAARMVRLRMPGSALRLVGVPVRPDAAEQQFVADVLIAQDGSPYALRLVNQ
jgi:hypothetical protein